ncbi:GH25 family lysozyme [Agromyces sp. NPDC058104]|uniref:GH25 family lysozyme n=1 Tax=Agromyces sp. NPDC058104 TaxID=3346342 RepID=UPI0036DBACBF
MSSFGIDVSGSQIGIDYGRARREGVEFLIAKAAGQQTGTPYTAAGYQQHIDGARRAGIPGVGHYYLPGEDDPGIAFDDIEAQADHFVRSLYKFDRDHDVLALDNEPLDGDPTFLRQNDVMRFFGRVRARTGIPFSRLWLYCPAHLTRTNGPWDKVTDAGIRIWWSAYGDFPTGHTPDHTPSLQGRIDRWDVHQFTSRASVAGLSVDGNYSKHSVATLFAGKASAPVPAPSAPSGGKLQTTAVNDGDPGEVYWTLVQTIGRRMGLYPHGYLIDGDPGPMTRKVETIILARMLNSMKLGRTTNADADGDPYQNGDPRQYSNFVWLGQTAARRRGWYPATSKIDGIDGPNSRKGRVRLLAEWLNKHA